MSGLHPGFIAGDLDKSVGQALCEIAEYDHQEKETIAAQEKMEEATRNNMSGAEIPPKDPAIVRLNNDVHSTTVKPIKESHFVPVSEDEKRKGAAMYAKLLWIRRNAEIAAKKRMNESVDTILKFQREWKAPNSAAARAYWQRQILLGRV